MPHGFYKKTLPVFSNIIFYGQVLCPVQHFTMCRFLVEVFLDPQPNPMLEEHTTYIGILKKLLPSLCLVEVSSVFTS
jgi:hypothetical protein